MLCHSSRLRAHQRLKERPVGFSSSGCVEGKSDHSAIRCYSMRLHELRHDVWVLSVEFAVKWNEVSLIGRHIAELSVPPFHESHLVIFPCSISFIDRAEKHTTTRFRDYSFLDVRPNGLCVMFFDLSRNRFGESFVRLKKKKDRFIIKAPIVH